MCLDLLLLTAAIILVWFFWFFFFFSQRASPSEVGRRTGTHKLAAERIPNKLAAERVPISWPQNGYPRSWPQNGYPISWPQNGYPISWPQNGYPINRPTNRTVNLSISLKSDSGDSSVVRAPDSWAPDSRIRVPAGAAGEYSSPGSTFCADSYYTRVTTVPYKISRLFWQKCRWHVTAKHACTLRTWLCMKWRDIAHGCMVYTEHAKTATVSRGTSHVTTKQRCK